MIIHHSSMSVLCRPLTPNCYMVKTNACFGVRVSVIFHFMCVHIIFSSVAE